MRPVLAAIVLVAGLGIPATFAADMDGKQIRQTLSGNSIVSPSFGCLYYSPDGKTSTVNSSGDMFAGTWGINGNLYISSGRCGLAGCHVSGEYPEITYRSIDGEYVLPVTVVKGNFCQKNVVVS